jgi:fumarate hydratase, class II
MTGMRRETDSLGVVEVPADKLWGAQTQRSLEHFSIGHDLIPREMIGAYTTLKTGAAVANHVSKQLDDQRSSICWTITRPCSIGLSCPTRPAFCRSSTTLP